MEIVNGIQNYQNQDGGVVLALGNFDGLHLAHRNIIKRTRQNAIKRGLKSVVFLLDPHPVKVLYPDRNFKLLTSLEEKLEKLESLGIDRVVVEPFTDTVSTLAPFHFAQTYLKDTLNVSKIIVGFDYTFGRKGQGTVNHLLRWGERLGFDVDIVSPIMHGNDVVSSSLVRELLTTGDVAKAAEILGCFYSRTGKVVHGDGRGRQVGFPTANLAVQEELMLPGRGVYLSLVTRGQKKMFGLTNIGIKPTFCNDNKTTTEVFILDFKENIYFEELTIYFLHKIRDEHVFNTVSEFKRQVEIDVYSARQLIAETFSFLLHENISKDCCPMFTKLT